MTQNPHVNITFKGEEEMYRKLAHLSVDTGITVPEMARRLLRAVADNDPRAVAIATGTDKPKKGKGDK